MECKFTVLLKVKWRVFMFWIGFGSIKTLISFRNYGHI